jgi:hypothetical protein
MQVQLSEKKYNKKIRDEDEICGEILFMNIAVEYKGWTVTLNL